MSTNEISITNSSDNSKEEEGTEVWTEKSQARQMRIRIYWMATTSSQRCEIFITRNLKKILCLCLRGGEVS